MTAYYNEINKEAAAWLRALIAEGHIAPGIVDERSIEDVYPSDLRGFTQCHFFAGIGVWSYALRRAGWPDDRSVWTGSCPCQPFSSAGQGAGFDDERHLWPAFHHLIRECKPAAVLGEQVASKDADPWIDLVHTDLEALGYAFGAVPFPSAGIGAPHIRDRLYWVAHAHRDGRQPWRQRRTPMGYRAASESDRRAGVLGDTIGTGLAQRIGLGRIPGGAGGADAGQAAERAGLHAGGLANTNSADTAQINQGDDALYRERSADGRRAELTSRPGTGSRVGSRLDRLGRGGIGLADALAGLDRPGPVNGFWGDVDWIFCRDDKWRPVEPGTFPLAHGAPARVGRLRGYGNAINAEAARVFIEAVM